MNFLVDGLIIAIVIACCVIGCKSGFIKMTVRFFKNIIALIIAAVFTSQLGNFFYEKIFKNVFENMTVNKICNWLGIERESNPDIGPLIDAEHSEFLSFIEKLGFNIESVSEKYNDLAQSAGDGMVEYIAKPIAVTVSNVVAFITLFIVSVLLVKLIGFILGKIAKLPVLNVTNRFLGLILGLILAVIFVFIFVSLVNVLLPYIKINGEHLATKSFEDGTILYKFLVTQTPSGLLENILSKIGVI